jgi:cobalt-zinc-cadmium efflux system outer membrane protein
MSGWFLTSGVVAPVEAAIAPPYPALLAQAQTSAPRLIESNANVGIAQGDAQQAASRPNPVLGLQVENIGVDDAGGVSQRESTLAVSQALELGGKRRARIAAGGAEVTAAEARQSLAAVDFAYDLAITYAAAEAAQMRVDVLVGDLGRARDDVRAARALVTAGREADLRAVQAQAAAAAAEADVQGAKADLSEALTQLSILAGAPEIYAGVTPSLMSRADRLMTPDLASGVSPTLQVAEAEREAAARRVTVERSRATPDLTFSVGARQFAGHGDTGFVAGLSAPLPLFDRNRGSVAAANARLNAANARLNGARLESEGSRRAAAAQANALQARLSSAIQSEAAANEAYGLARLGYEGGKTPLAEVLNARRALTEAQGRQLDARLARLRAEAALARLLGRTPFGED